MFYALKMIIRNILKVISDKFGSKIKAILAITFGAVLLFGCGSVQETDDVNLEALGEAMSRAHFISAPVTSDDSTAKVTEFTASCKITSKDDHGFFVLGDEGGEYGNLLMIGTVASEDSDRVVIRCSNKAVTSDIFEEDFDASSISHDGVFDIRISVRENLADITIGEKELGSFEVPFTELGCAGVFRGRGLEDAYIDDIRIEADNKVIFQDDFDGSFTNELYSYDYSQEATSAFSPYYYKTHEEDGNKSLIIPSGFLLSETKGEAAPVFRKEFSARVKDLKKAYLCMTALGSFEATLNSKKVADSFFDPGRMVFDKYLNYVYYDVKDLLSDENDLRIYLFHGFYDRGVGHPGATGAWGETRAIKGALVLEYKDGSSEVIPTDDTFLVSGSTRYRFDDIYNGEIIDDRIDEDLGDFQQAKVDEVEYYYFTNPIVPKENEPIRAYRYIEPVNVTEPVPGHYVYDFGENIAGTVMFDPEKTKDTSFDKGQVVTFRYGELLNTDKLVNADGPEGTVWTRNLLTARNTDLYVFGEKSTREPVVFSHTYHGFRYVEITGIDSALPKEAISAVAISSDLETTGQFMCSNETINAFYDNSVRSFRSNLMDVPTDCAQRDERLGWTGDAQATSLFGMYQYDARKFYRNYLKEIRLQQDEKGRIGDLAPVLNPFGGSSCWGDSIVTITWNYYLQYGDLGIIDENLEAAARWVDYLVENSDDYLFESGGYGDHLSAQYVSEKLSDTAWCAHSARLLSKMYEAVGNQDGQKKYEKIADNFIRKWQDTFIYSQGTAESGILIPEEESETAYALGLYFGLFPEDIKPQAALRLKLLAEYGGYQFYPGYSGMEFFLPCLCEYGYGDTAALVMTNTEPGGLSHPLAMGLTTNPENINAFRYTDPQGEEYPDGRYYISASLNHAAYSSVSEICYKYILGISADEKAPGYEHFYIKPMMTTGIESASGSFKSLRGEISVSWDSSKKSLTCSVPKGSTCTVILPNGESKEVSEGDHSFNW